MQHVGNKFNLVSADGEWFIWLESLQENIKKASEI